MSRLAIWTITTCSLFTAALTGADNWTQFRGSDGSGVTKEGQIPAEWGNDRNIQWKTSLPGYGWSCPIVWGEKVFVTSAIADKQKKPTAGFGGGGGGFGKGGFG